MGQARQRIQRFILVAGFFVLSLGVSAGLLTASTLWASGVTTGSNAQAMANDAFSYPLVFDASIQTSLDQLQSADPAATDITANFYAAYVTATQHYGTALLSAAEMYNQHYLSDPAGAKNAYIDSFNTARASYFGQLEAARNTVVVELAGTNDVAKDMFVNEYNAARDLYNSQLESVKNQIAEL